MKQNVSQLIQWIKNQDNPVFFMTAGLPGSGKSTLLSKLRAEFSDMVVASTDDIIEREGQKMGLNYSEAFNKLNFKRINAEFKQVIDQAIKDRKMLVIDQTNVSGKSRRSKLEQIPKTYVRACLVFDVPEAVLTERLAKRAAETGKSIPPHVIRSMASTWQTPSRADGFDFIIDVIQGH